MAKEKKSFFERLTGTIKMDDARFDAEEEREIAKSASSWIEENDKGVSLLWMSIKHQI